MRRLALIAVACVHVDASPVLLAGTTNIVTSLADGGPGSLRQAIADALPGEVITFSTNGTITLTNGELVIYKNLDIIGPGATNLAISGNLVVRVFNIPAGVTSSISGLTIRDGRTAGGSPGALSGRPGGSGGHGGGIFNSGALILNACVITANATGAGGDGAIGDIGTGGESPGPGELGGSGGFGGNGGGLHNEGKLMLDACMIVANATGSGGLGGTGGPGGMGLGMMGGTGGPGGQGGWGGNGGGIHNVGMLSLNDCTVRDNSAGNGGPGGTGGRGGFAINCPNPINCAPDGTGGNGGVGGFGGGIWNEQGAVSVTGCTINGNRAGAGGRGGSLFDSSLAAGAAGIGGNCGGIGNKSTLRVCACTISENSAGPGAPGRKAYSSMRPGPTPGGQGGHGGGVFNASNLEITACTFTGNSAGAGGAGGPGYYSSDPPGQPGSPGIGGGIYATESLSLGNSLFASNGTDVVGPFSAQGTNLIGIDPLLGPLADNGGPTPTHALLPGSPAIDAGDDTLSGTDQRGRPRRSGAHVDIGAYEFQSASFSGASLASNGTFAITSTSDVPFHVLATKNIALPVGQWLDLGAATPVGPGLFQFSDPGAANNQYRFYRLRSP